MDARTGKAGEPARLSGFGSASVLSDLMKDGVRGFDDHGGLGVAWYAMGRHGIDAAWT